MRAEEFAGASSQGGDAQSVGRTWHGDGKGLGEEAGAVMRKEDAGKSIGTPGSWFKSIGDKVVYARELKKNLRKLVADNIVEVLCLSVCLSVCAHICVCARSLSPALFVFGLLRCVHDVYGPATSLPLVYRRRWRSNSRWGCSLVESGRKN
jgi:hypothetical protein